MRRELKLNLFRLKWRKNNKHNFTVPMNVFPINNVIVGNNTYGQLNVVVNSLNYILKIGNYCSIADNCEFVLSGDHQLNTISTYPFKVKIIGEKYEALSKGNIVLEDDVWIGHGSIILSGVTISRGAVIAAGSVVTKDVEPYAIVAGNPARVIKYRFSDNIIKELMNIDYSKWNKEFITNHIDILYKNIDDIDENEMLKFIDEIK